MAVSIQSYSQETLSDSLPRFTDIFVRTSFLEYSAEYYVINDANSFLEHHFLYQPVIGRTSTITLEGSIVNSFLQQGNVTSPGDFSITYQRLFKAANYKKSGWQGVAAALKFKMPTGRTEYFSGFDSWILEPLVGTQWLLNVPEWFVSLQARYSWAFASLPDKSPQSEFVRLEAFFGYENQHFFAFVQPDYRYVPLQETHTLFLNFEGSYKISDKGGIRVQYKPRLSGDSFFRSLTLLGVYFYFQ